MKFTPEHRQLEDTVKSSSCDKETQPAHCRSGRRQGQFPGHEVFKKLGDLGLLGLKYPEEFGGAGLDFSYCDGHGRGAGPMQLRRRADGHRRAYRHGHAGAGAFRHATSCAPNSSRRPSPATWSACLGVSEPGGGSDVAAVKTTARSEGGDYVINGTKMWITNGMKADWCCLLANTSDGPPHKNKSLIVVPMDAPGITRQKIHKIGMDCVGHRAALLRQRARAEDAT